MTPTIQYSTGIFSIGCECRINSRCHYLHNKDTIQIADK